MPSLKLLMTLLRGRESKEDRSLRRYAGILRGGATAIIAKMCAAAAGFAAVPLTLGHLGAERYGLWATLYSALAWLGLMDLGLANGLMNALSDAYGRQRPDLAREYLSTGFWGLGAIALLAGVAIAIGLPWIDWSAAMNIASATAAQEFGAAVTMAAAIFLLMLPFTIVSRVYIAHQQGEIANLWTIAGTVAGLVGLALAILAQGGLPLLVLGFSGGQCLVLVASGVWLVTRWQPQLRPALHVSRASLRKVFNLAASFFITQVATLLLFQSGNIIIARSLGAEHVTPYQITWLLFFYVTLPQQLIGANIWAAIGEAYARGEIVWIQRLFRRYLLATLAFSVPILLVLTAFADVIIRIWAGPQAVPDRDLVHWMAVWAAELVVMQSLIAVLGGTGQLRTYSILSLIGAATAVMSALWAVHVFGTVGVIASFAIVFGALVFLPAIQQVRSILRSTPAMECREHA